MRFSPIISSVQSKEALDPHVMAFTKLAPTLSYLGATVLLLFSRVTKLSTASATRAPCGQSRALSHHYVLQIMSCTVET